MSTKEKWISVKAIIIVVIGALLTQLLTSVYQARVVQAETVRNTEAIKKLKSANDNFVLKSDNQREHSMIYSSIKANENKSILRNQKLIESIDANQKFIIERIDNVNNNILRLHGLTAK